MPESQLKETLARWYYFIPQLVALLIIGPLAWLLVVDRVPPLVLYDGHISPEKVYPGQEGVTVVWRARFSGRDCPGFSQRELIDYKGNLWPKRARPRAGTFHPSPTDPFTGTVTTPPLDVPLQMEPGPAHYRVTQFYYCNSLQGWLQWPVVETSVTIKFEVLPKEDAP